MISREHIAGGGWALQAEESRYARRLRHGAATDMGGLGDAAAQRGVTKGLSNFLGKEVQSSQRYKYGGKTRERESRGREGGEKDKGLAGGKRLGAEGRRGQVAERRGDQVGPSHGDATNLRLSGPVEKHEATKFRLPRQLHSSSFYILHYGVCIIVLITMMIFNAISIPRRISLLSQIINPPGLPSGQPAYGATKR